MWLKRFRLWLWERVDNVICTYTFKLPRWVAKQYIFRFRTQVVLRHLMLARIALQPHVDPDMIWGKPIIRRGYMKPLNELSNSELNNRIASRLGCEMLQWATDLNDAIRLVSDDFNLHFSATVGWVARFNVFQAISDTPARAISEAWYRFWQDVLESEIRYTED